MKFIADVALYYKDGVKGERQCDARVKFLRTDNGLEFVNNEVKAFLHAHGIVGLLESNENSNNSELRGSRSVPTLEELRQSLVVGQEACNSWENCAVNDDSAHAVTCDWSLHLSHREPRSATSSL